MTDNVKKRDLVVTRVFDAPIELVWKAWSDSDEVKKWWGPTGFTCPVAEMDFREVEHHSSACAHQRNMAAKTCTARGHTRRSCRMSGSNTPSTLRTKTAISSPLPKWACPPEFQRTGITLLPSKTWATIGLK